MPWVGQSHGGQSGTDFHSSLTVRGLPTRSTEWHLRRKWGGGTGTTRTLRRSTSFSVASTKLRPNKAAPAPTSCCKITSQIREPGSFGKNICVNNWLPRLNRPANNASTGGTGRVPRGVTPKLFTSVEGVVRSVQPRDGVERVEIIVERVEVLDTFSFHVCRNGRIDE
jgi:hypothetical protein